MKILKAIPKIGFGSININLPKEAISGKVPAWLIWGSSFALTCISLRIWHLKNERDREAKKDIATIKARKTSCRSNCVEETTNTTNISEPGCMVMEESGKMPDWVDAASIEDKPIDSSLIAQSGALVVVKAREGQGKSTIVNQLLAEACEGLSSNLFPNCDGVVGPKWNVFLYASEASPKFKSNFGVKLAEFGSRFKVTSENFTFKSVDSALTHIRQAVMNAQSNCAVGIDNITDMFPKISSADAKRFMQGLKDIREEMNASCRESTFLIVVHANRVTEEAAGSSVWQNLAEVVMSVGEDRNKLSDDYKILRISKSRLGACQKISIRRIMTPYMHFEYYSDAVVNEETTHTDTVNVAENSKIQPITPDVEEFLASIYKPKVYGYGTIYKDYKNTYLLTSKDHVRNIIDRVKKRKGEVA